MHSVRRFVAAFARTQSFRESHRTLASAATVFTFVLLGCVSSAPADNIRVERDEDTFTTSIRIDGKRGRVAWSDVLRGIARAREFDDDALAGLVPDKSFSITGARSVLLCEALNLVSTPQLHFSIVRDKEDDFQEPKLLIRMNREAVLASERRIKQLLRDKLSAKLLGKKLAKPSGDYGLKLDKKWKRADKKKPLVVLIHGFNSNPESVEPLLNEARDKRFPCATFQYPNDQSIDKSAKLLSRELKGFAEDHEDRRVTLITHSMGGLVARAAIENPDLDPGNVVQLIMLAPPNHGSMLAHFAYGLDIYEHIVEDDRKLKVRNFYRAIEDGFAEAAEDLRPDSVFLTKLNRRKRNPDVRYTIILGSNAALSKKDLAAVREKLAKAGDRSRWVRFFGGKVDTWLADMDEVVEGLGDGAVAVKRGRLGGVEDAIVLHFGHHEILSCKPAGDVKRAHDEVLKRLLEATDE